MPADRKRDDVRIKMVHIVFHIAVDSERRAVKQVEAKE
jgi:hypothetical protein